MERLLSRKTLPAGPTAWYAGSAAAPPTTRTFGSRRNSSPPSPRRSRSTVTTRPPHGPEGRPGPAAGRGFPSLGGRPSDPDYAPARPSQLLAAPGPRPGCWVLPSSTGGRGRLRAGSSGAVRVVDAAGTPSALTWSATDAGGRLGRCRNGATRRV